jgi:hypothetical protein
MTQIKAFSPQRLYKFIKYLQTIYEMLFLKPSFFSQQQAAQSWNGIIKRNLILNTDFK